MRKNCICAAANLWRCLSHSRRQWKRRCFFHRWKFEVQTEAYGYSTPFHRFISGNEAHTEETKTEHANLVSIPIHATPKQQSRAVDLRRSLGRCAVLPRFSEHWRWWNSSELRQRRTTRATTVMKSGVRWRHFSGVAFVILSAVYGLRPALPITRFRCCMLSWPGKQLQGVFEKLHALILHVQ